MRPFPTSTFLGGVVFLAVISVPLAEADKARVLKATANVGGSYTFLVTVAHADSGWKHYADKFEVLAADGTVLETRILYHPHVGQRAQGGQGDLNRQAAAEALARQPSSQAAGKKKGRPRGLIAPDCFDLDVNQHLVIKVRERFTFQIVEI